MQEIIPIEGRVEGINKEEKDKKVQSSTFLVGITFCHHYRGIVKGLFLLAAANKWAVSNCIV